MEDIIVDLMRVDNSEVERGFILMLPELPKPQDDLKTGAPRTELAFAVFRRSDVIDDHVTELLLWNVVCTMIPVTMQKRVRSDCIHRVETPVAATTS